MSRICFELDAEVSELRGRDLSGQRFPYPWADATYAPCRRGGHGATAAVVTAVAVGEDGIRRVVGLARVDSESYASWKGFLRGLRERGLEGVQCAASDAHGGIVRAVREVFPGAAWQRVNVNPSFTDSTNAIAPIAPTHPRRFRRRQAPFPASRSGARSFVR